MIIMQCNDNYGMRWQHYIVMFSLQKIATLQYNVIFGAPWLVARRANSYNYADVPKKYQGGCISGKLLKIFIKLLCLDKRLSKLNFKIKKR